MASRITLETDGTVSSFNDWIRADSSTEFRPEADRYHLYIQHLCPFCNITTAGRALKGLEKVISVDNLDYVLEDGEQGWKFSPEKEGCDADSVNGASYLKEVYEASAKKLGASGYSGEVSAPVLFDKKLGRIVSTESADILHMLNSEFNDFCETEEQRRLDLYPDSLSDKIKQVENWTYRDIILGVYNHKFAKTQQVYDEAIKTLFDSLDKVEAILSKQRYLTGSQLTGADVKLFCCFIRFDIVYAQIMCAKKRLCDYPGLWGYLRDLYSIPALKSTVNLDQIITGYFTSYYFKANNSYGLIPVRPDLDYDLPSGRERM